MTKRFALHTFKGNFFDPKTGELSKADITDIAHALSHICRYSGHCKKFYSVAEHSVLVYRIAKELYPDDLEIQWAALLHDATEAYVGDVTTPLKVLLPNYEDVEEALSKKIAKEFKIRQTKRVHSGVKMADIIALATEANRLFRDVSHWPSLKGIATKDKLLKKSFPQSPDAAKKDFLKEFRALQKKVEKFKNAK